MKDFPHFEHHHGLKAPQGIFYPLSPKNVWEPGFGYCRILVVKYFRAPS